MSSKNVQEGQYRYQTFRMISYIPLHLIKFLKSIGILFLFRRTVVKYYINTFGYIASVITIEKELVNCQKDRDLIVQAMILNPDPKFRVSTRTHMLNSRGVLLIFDKQTLREEDKYFEIISRFEQFYEGKSYPIMLVLLDEHISSEEIRQFDSLTEILKKRTVTNSTKNPGFFKVVLEKSQKQLKQHICSFISKVACSYLSNRN